ncbi:MAG: pyridoxamine 5'-phosphate oxidase family protein [Methanosarcina sp.]|jgi:predicted pyridoxine 5'-phosphate oxidase superfamily flavin-nucleotide-binding protein|uniref:Pyridoxamine 5-phosphate oxidase n=1 Tax=Methanosarcina flavescens TaxID=1715806 RepID=A0A660HU35_9EURY|nr:pyridoxamine 5'-phosphate oxidase family protein [Methanosarcina flavescens]MDD2615315.1 pyridoxamine 5'-phosphate oxidase family protein [Methanosarcina sp.]AYK15807.1 pyridoxamine 5-phosphate oxidase [Methanosarcina flavescens]MDD3317948.1 pyridoxamine 5'-phosphate oxidase family protein [Methanosarcina sp.]MDD4523397.1 pyridoxamine 5'-phosphate oxidase family protein [Methanosarcina sp.]HHV23214.1 pyridoxamine 5-phosphate oxidase [Methanosarcina sp.]
MVKLTDEMKQDFAKMKIFPFATASKGGEPNVIPIGMCKLQEDGETIWITDNYFLKTRKNLDENPRGAIYVWGPEIEGCYQIKGDIEIKTEGEDYEKMYKMVKGIGERFPAKALAVMKITEVYECKAFTEPGKRLL